MCNLIVLRLPLPRRGGDHPILHQRVSFWQVNVRRGALDSGEFEEGLSCFALERLFHARLLQDEMQHKKLSALDDV